MKPYPHLSPVLLQHMETTALISSKFSFFPLGSSEAEYEGGGRLMAFPAIPPYCTQFCSLKTHFHFPLDAKNHPGSL